MTQWTLPNCLNQTQWQSHYLITDSKYFCSEPKKELRINNTKVYRDIFINVNLTSLTYSLLKKLLILKRNDAKKTTWQASRWFIHNKEKFLWKKKEVGATKVPHTSLPILAYTSFSTVWMSSTVSHRPESGVAHIHPPSPAEPEANTPEKGTDLQLPPAHSTWIISRVFCHLD